MFKNTDASRLFFQQPLSPAVEKFAKDSEEATKVLLALSTK